MKKAFFLLPCSLLYFFSIAQLHTEIPGCQHLKQQFSSGKYSGPSLQATNQRSDTIDILKYTINLNITDFTAPDTIRGNTVIRFAPKMNNINTISLDLLGMIIDSVEIGTTNLTSGYD